MLYQIYSSQVFIHAIALNPKEKIVKGLLTLVISIEKKFNLQEESKVPKELLKHDIDISDID